MTEPVPEPAARDLLADAVFPRLVAAEDDLVGLLAYALHRRTFADWLAGFRQETGRDPAPSDVQSFEIGERVERRLTEYRERAERVLAGQGGAAPGPVQSVPADQEMAVVAAGQSVVLKPAVSPKPDPALARKKIVAGLVIFVLLVIGVIAARRALGV